MVSPPKTTQHVRLNKRIKGIHARWDGSRSKIQQNSFFVFLSFFLSPPLSPLLLHIGQYHVIHSTQSEVFNSTGLPVLRSPIPHPVHVPAAKARLEGDPAVGRRKGNSAVMSPSSTHISRGRRVQRSPASPCQGYSSRWSLPRVWSSTLLAEGPEVICGVLSV